MAIYTMMYDVGEGIVYEDYEIVRLNVPWCEVMLSRVVYKEDCECEGDSCEHRFTCEQVGGEHPASATRPRIGSGFKARALKDLIEEYGVYKCIKIYYGRGRIGIATRIVT